jgi:hypothetical protein
MSVFMLSDFWNKGAVAVLVTGTVSVTGSLSFFSLLYLFIAYSSIAQASLFSSGSLANAAFLMEVAS